MMSMGFAPACPRKHFSPDAKIMAALRICHEHDNLTGVGFAVQP